MSLKISEQTKAILLLTTPLIVGTSRQDDAKILSPTEYNKVAARLIELNHQPLDLLGSEREDLLQTLGTLVDPERLSRLLDRGLLMSQAIDRWQSRGIWVVSRADPRYPRRLKAKLKQHAPPVLFGCGEMGLLEKGGLCIVGSRKVDDAISQFVENAAKLASNSGYTVISGGARGVDQIAMKAALAVEGTVIGALAENLSRAVVNPDYRNALRAQSLTLISAVDPAAGFNVGNAMARNKLIYALADIGLVANADFEKGGTWAGAIEQIRRFKCCPVFVRTTNSAPKGNKALIERGARPWPDPDGADAFRAIMEAPAEAPSELNLVESLVEETSPETPVQQLRQSAHVAILNVLAERPMSEAELAEALGLEKSQARAWLGQLVELGRVEATKRPARYKIRILQPELFQ